MLNGFGTVINSLGRRAKPYLPQVSDWLSTECCYIAYTSMSITQRTCTSACGVGSWSDVGPIDTVAPPATWQTRTPTLTPGAPLVALAYQVCGTIKWRLNNKSAKIRQQAADLIARIAPVMKSCEEEQLLGHLGVVLYEYLGEEYPEVLGSILGALKAIVNVIGMTKMTPPIKELLPRLTPILKNRHEKVQENCIDLVGRIADRGASYVPAREWMRICFELLDMLKAHKKAIRRATVNTFGYIAKAIGPQVRWWLGMVWPTADVCSCAVPRRFVLAVPYAQWLACGISWRET